MPRPAALAWLLLAAGTTSAHAQAVIDSLALRDHARALAHDSLLGRDTGSPGAAAAARYIAGVLGGLGLEPLAGDSFLQPLPLIRARLDADSRITVERDGARRTFAAHRDFVAPPGGRGSLRPFEGPVVLMPPGATGDGAAVRGSVLLLSEAPDEAMAGRIRAWIRAGAAGAIVPLADPAMFDAARARPAGRLFVDAAVDDPIWQPDLPIVYAGPDLVAALVAGANRAAAGEPVPLGRTLGADLRYDTEPVEAANVGAILHGSGDTSGVVLLTAHYDHLGTGPPVDGDSIYNGFSDNAAGVAMLLGIAAALRDAPPAHSVAFLFTTGEERGLLGSTAWAADPPFPLDRIRFVLNLDAGAPPAPPIRWRIAGDTTQPLLQRAADIVRRNGWTPDITDTRANSDHWPFMDRGVPAIFLVPGRDWEGLDEAAETALFQKWDHYHRPGDEWREAFPMAGLVRFAGLALEILLGL